MSSCIFCAIGRGELPADVVRETENVVVFHDVSPQAPIHLLVIPRTHYVNVDEMTKAAPELAAEMLHEASMAAAQEALADGYRLVFNTGKEGGQTVEHVHAHVLGGRQMTWPPG